MKVFFNSNVQHFFIILSDILLQAHCLSGSRIIPKITLVVASARTVVNNEKFKSKKPIYAKRSNAFILFCLPYSPIRIRYFVATF